MDMDAVADKYVNAEAAQCLEGANDYETLRNVWRFVKSNVTYKADKKGTEIVKSPSALFIIGRGDCKSFSISVASLLRALGFKGFRYRFAAYRNNANVTHVYVVCRLGGKDVILDAVHDYFDHEVRYAWKKDHRAAIGVNGIGRISDSNTQPSNLIAWALIAWGAINL